MNSYDLLIRKLEGFIRRFYLNELVKGAIFFLSLGLLYFLFTLLIEYFLWLEPLERQILFWLFIAVEGVFLLKFIIFPLLKLFKISKGLDYAEASRIIGRHFPEVNDKLLNLLQLREKGKPSELLLAGIDQKARELQPVPIKRAVNFKSNLSFLKYLAIPAAIIVLVFASGNANLFAASYKRVVDYKTEYTPPAPFHFEIISALKVLENEDFRLKVKTVGKLKPENLTIQYNGESYFLKNKENAVFEYDFGGLSKSIEFILSANGITSDTYKLEVVEVPKMTNFKMVLNYPAYTMIKDEAVEGSGNATIPEGTEVEWEIETTSTNEVQIQFPDTLRVFKKVKKSYSFRRNIFENVEYQVSASNNNVENYEKLTYSLHVIKDEFPVMELESKKDSLGEGSWYFHGRISDDYGFSRLNLKYYPEDDPKKIGVVDILVSKGNLDEFLFAFPGNIVLKKGKNYQFFFELEDNDPFRKGKSVKSQLFNFREKTDEELQSQNLEEQKDAIRGIDNSLEKMESAEENLEEISRLQKEKGKLDYNDVKKLQDYFERQHRQNEILQQHTQQLKEALQEQSQSKKNDFKEQLEERIKQREKQLRENEELLKELEKYSDKIQEEELAKQLEELSRRNQSQEKNLEQLLELTKRYYVQEKAAKVANDLEKLGEDQEQLSERDEHNSEEAQSELNERFEKLQKEMRALEQENENLKEPMELGQEKSVEEEIKEKQQEASKNLADKELEKAKKNQQTAAEKLKELSQKMRIQQRIASGFQMQEDEKMLRKILDNLLVFSFEQEDLLNAFEEMNSEDPAFAQRLRKQNLLKLHFEHVNDSLYVLALRNPMLTEKITQKLTDISFDLEKALERFSQKEVAQGVASQHYIITGANDLAYLLDEIMENMQQMLNPSSGSGNGMEMQLPDIIEKQSQINRQMKEGLEEKDRESGQKKGSGSEAENGELYEIYKNQELLRRALQEKLEQQGRGNSGEEVKQEMKQIEREILEKGYNRETLNRMLKLEQRLLDLKDALLRQGQKRERESETNTSEFDNPINQKLKLEEYFPTTEILSRQSLPLRQIYKQKVKEYFERRNN